MTHCPKAKDFTEFYEFDETWGLGTMKNSAGVLQWNPHNLLKSSEDFASSDWYKTDTTVTSNAATAPDGTLTADKITHTDSSSSVTRNTTSVDGKAYVGGLLFKYIDVQWATLQLDGSKVWVDIQNGVIGTDNIGGTTLLNLGDGWYYVYAEKASVGTTFTFTFSLQTADGSSTEAVGSAYIWGAHLYRNDLGGMAKVPESDRALSALEYYVPNKAVVTGSNLVSNGTFDSNTDGWTVVDGTFAVSGGTLLVTNDGGGVNIAYAYQAVTTEIGKAYRVGFENVATDVPAIRVGTTAGAANLLSYSNIPQGAHTGYFTATSTTTYITLQNNAVAGAADREWDNITVEEVDRNPSAARYLPRRENHEYINGSWVKGLLVEPDGATNLVTYSEDLSNAAWSRGAEIRIDTPLETAGLSLDYIRNNGTGLFLSLHQSVGSVADDGYLCVSCFIKDGDSPETAIRIDDGTTSNRCTVPITWTSGVPSLQTDTTVGLTYHDSGLINCGGGVYRVWLTAKNETGGALTLNHKYYVTWNTTPAAADEYTYAGGFQAEAGLVPTSYIPTSGSAVSRGAETTTIPADVMDSLGLFNTVAVDGTELVTNGTFATNDLTGWTDNSVGAGTVVASTGAAVHTGASGSDSARLYQDLTLVSGSVYELTFTISDVTTPSGLVRCGASTTGSEEFSFDVDANGEGTHTVVFVSGGVSRKLNTYSLNGAFTIDNISVKEIHRRAIGIQMHGYVSYGDEDLFNTVVFSQCNADADNNIKIALDTKSTETGEINWRVETAGTQDHASTATDAYSPGVNVPFKIAGRFLDNSLQGAADGTATTENTTPVGLPDLSGVDLEVAYSGPALHITKFNIFAENIKASDGTFKMNQTFLERASV